MPIFQQLKYHASFSNLCCLNLYSRYMAHSPTQRGLLPLSFSLECCGKLASSTNFITISNKTQWNGCQSCTDTSKQRTRLGNTQSFEHIFDSEWEESTSNTTRGAQCRQGRGRVDTIRIRNVLILMSKKSRMLVKVSTHVDHCYPHDIVSNSIRHSCDKGDRPMHIGPSRQSNPQY